MKTDQIAQLLKGSMFFRGLSDDHEKALAALCIVDELVKRDFLFMEGERAHSIYQLISGRIQLVKTSEDGKEVVIKTVEPGEIFAEAVLFEMDTYPVSAIALKESKVLRIPKADFMDLMENAYFRDDFIAHLMKRMRYLAERILHLTAHDVETRFFSFLEEQYGRKNVYTVGMSKKDLAAAIGATPETLSRLILRLEKDGKIEWTGRTLNIL